MSINMIAVSNSAAQCRSCASDLEAAASNLRAYQNSLNAVWTGPEMGHINAALEGALADLNRVASALRGIGSDIGVAATAINAQDALSAAQASAGLTAHGSGGV